MRALTVACVSAALITTAARADDRAVEFDVVSTVAVREVVSSEEFPVAGISTGADEKLIAIRLQVSTYVAPQSRAAVSDVVISFDSPGSGFQVVDFSPKTTLDTRFAGPVAVQESSDRSLGIDFDATGFYKSLTGATLTGSFRDTQQRNADFQLLPPKEVVAASGTIQRGHGVYFKLLSSPSNTIEGAKEFLIVARVPLAWRGDLARVRCTAGGESASALVPFEQSQQLAQCDFLLGLHLEGDAEAAQRAQNFVSCEQWLRRVAAEQRSPRGSSSKLLQKIGFASPNLPAYWLNDWLYGPTKPEVARQLPEPVRQAALHYITARSELHTLSGKHAPRVAARASIGD